MQTERSKPMVARARLSEWTAPAEPSAPPSAPRIPARRPAKYPPMSQVWREIETVATTDLNILLLGETGVGKEVLSKAIHDRSLRRRQPLVVLNCASMPENLLESELFGFEAGAFTGASRQKHGRLEEANRGIVFMDEIGELAPAAQAKLLRVLDSGHVSRLGATTDRRLDLQFISATNRDLQTMVRKGTFRADLMYRLQGATIFIPPLRQRLDEIPALAAEFLAESCKQSRRRPPLLSEGALAELRSYAWPGNIRELKAMMERTIASVPGPVIEAQDLRHTERWPATAAEEEAEAAAVAAEAPGLPSPPVGPGRRPIELSRDRVLEALTHCGCNQTLAARQLGVSRGTLGKRMALFAIRGPRQK